MEYAPYHELAGRPSLILDGSPTDGTVLTVTHWPGYIAPPELWADLSAQMSFRLLDHPGLAAGAEVASNNHFDQDGLVSIHAVTSPEDALARRVFLEDVAAAGDFGTYRDRDAARVSMVLSAYAGGEGGLELPASYPDQTAVLYSDLLGRLPELCEHIDRYRHLWADEDATLDVSEQAIETGEVTISETRDVDLAVIDVPTKATRSGGHRFGGEWASGLHPMAVNNATGRLVVATVRGQSYEVELRYESWVQLRSRPLRLRRDLVPLAERLQHEERGDATWTAAAVGSLTPRLTSGAGDSSISRDRFLDLLVAHLDTDPPAWDPFRPKS